MGDRTPIEAIVYSCPPEEVNAVLEIFEEFGLDHQHHLPDDPPSGPDGRGPRRLELGRGYINSEISVGSSDELAALLPNAAAWKVWEDPMYEHLGQVHLNHPDLGGFASDCDAQGRPVFNSGEVDALVERTGGDRVQLGHLTGRTWEIALEQLDEANRGIVLRADAPPASAPLQAIALGQFAGGPSRWMPEDAPGQARSTAAPDR